MNKKIPVILVSAFFGIGAAFPALAVDFSDAAVIARVQEALNEEGYDCGTPDGKPGDKTCAAISQFRKDNLLAEGDAIDEELVVVLGLVDPDDTHKVEFESVDDNVKASIINVQDALLAALQKVFTEIGIPSGTVTDYGNASSTGGLIVLDAKVSTDTGRTLIATCMHDPSNIEGWEVQFIQDGESGHYIYLNEDHEGVENIYEYPTDLLAERIDYSVEVETEAEVNLPDGIEFKDNVPNDVTGKWRLAIVDTEQPITDYLLDYHKTYFKDDDEIHAVINRHDNTTARVAEVLGMLNVTIHKYISGEENDAKVLFGGDVISDEYYDMETGKVF